MKILWLSNNPCNALKKLSPQTVSGGWLLALNEHLVKQENIELHVCFYWQEDLSPFEFHQAKYHPIKKTKPEKLSKKVIEKFSASHEKSHIAAIKEVVDRVQPDIIHVHGTELNFGLIQFETDIPVVISIQGLLSPYYEKYFSGIPETHIKKIKKKGINLLPKALNNAFRLNAIRERKILKPTKYIIGRTDWDKRISGLLAPNRQYFIGNEILRESFYDIQHIWNKTEFSKPLKLITTTGDVAYKGFELIVKTAKILQDYDIVIEWQVVGLTTNSMVSRAVKRWLKLNYDQLGITFLGILNEAQLIDALKASDIYCQVSHIENSPNSLCEAMMLGVPTVATNVGGTSSILENNHEGILVQEGEPYDLAGAILELRNDFKKAQTYGDNGRKRALERHDPSKVVNEIVSAYKTINQKS